MKEALKFTMGFNEQLIGTLESQGLNLAEKEKMVNT